MSTCDYSWVDPRLAVLYDQISDESDRSRFMGLLDRIEHDIDRVSQQMGDES